MGIPAAAPTRPACSLALYGAFLSLTLITCRAGGGTGKTSRRKATAYGDTGPRPAISLIDASTNSGLNTPARSRTSPRRSAHANMGRCVRQQLPGPRSARRLHGENRIDDEDDSLPSKSARHILPTRGVSTNLVGKLGVHGAHCPSSPRLGNQLRYLTDGSTQLDVLDCSQLEPAPCLYLGGWELGPLIVRPDSDVGVWPGEINPRGGERK